MDAYSLLFASMRLLGWGLVHFVWQAMLVGLIYTAVRPLLPRGEVRYCFGLGILLVLAVCPLLTIWHLLNAESSISQMASRLVTPYGSAPAVSGERMQSWNVSLDIFFPWMVLVWFLGVLLLSLRAWRQWSSIKMLIRMAEPMPEWQSRVADMASRFDLRRHIKILFSRTIATPALVGWLRPVIVLPMAVACNFPAAQVELILAHELAHLRRWDPAANFFQIVLETLYFYHPVVQWISRDVRKEREICCDDLALFISQGNRRVFAEALTELGELRERQGDLLLAANGGVLLDRVQHMMLPPRQSTALRPSARFVAALLGSAILLLAIQVEWQHSRLQRRARESVAQWQSILAPRLLPVHLLSALAFSDLSPTHVNAADVLDQGAPSIAAVESARGAIANAVKSELLRLVPLKIADLVPITLSLMPAVVSAHAQLPDAAELPVPIHVLQPVYPEVALTRGIEGQVVVEFSVAANGSVEDLSIVEAKPSGIFNQAAIQSMQGWRYAVSSGNAVKRRYRQTLVFALDGVSRRTLSNSQTREEIQARTECEIATGTHICR